MTRTEKILTRAFNALPEPLQRTLAPAGVTMDRVFITLVATRDGHAPDVWATYAYGWGEGSRLGRTSAEVLEALAEL